MASLIHPRSIIMRDVSSFICGDKRVKTRLFGGAFDPSHHCWFCLMVSGCAGDAVAMLLPQLTCSVGQVMGDG
jgi:hypothetical protein